MKAKYKFFFNYLINLLQKTFGAGEKCVRGLHMLMNKKRTCEVYHDIQVK